MLLTSYYCWCRTATRRIERPPFPHQKLLLLWSILRQLLILRGAIWEGNIQKARSQMPLAPCHCRG